MESSLGILILIAAVGWVILRKFSGRSRGGGYVNNYPHEIQNQSDTNDNDDGDDGGDDGGD